MDERKDKGGHQPPVEVKHDHVEAKLTADPPKVLRGVVMRPPTAEFKVDS